MATRSKAAFDYFLERFQKPENLSKLNHLASLPEKDIDRIVRKLKRDVPNHATIPEDELILYFTDRRRFFEAYNNFNTPSFKWDPTMMNAFKKHSPGSKRNSMKRKSMKRKSLSRSKKSRNGSRNRSRNANYPFLGKSNNALADNVLSGKMFKL